MTTDAMTTQVAGSHTPQTPWSVKGIAPQTREAVKDAARRSGMTIGEWLNAAIARQAQAEHAPVRPSQAAASDERWTEVAAHLARLVRRPAAAPPDRSVSMHAVERLLREAETRAIRRERERATRLAAALGDLVRYIDHVEHRRADAQQRMSEEMDRTTHELSRTLAGIARQVKRVERRLERLPAVEQRLADGLGDILQGLQAVATQAAETAAVAREAAPDTEQLAVEDRLARAIVDIRTRQVELARLESDGEGETQHAIVERLEALSRKLDDALRPKEADDRAPAIGAVLERLDRIDARLGDDRAPTALGRLEDMVRGLSENVEALHLAGAPQGAPADEAALDTLAAQISQVAQRLEDIAHHALRTATDDAERGGADRGALSRLQELESAISVLSLQLRDLPRADEAALERVARAAAREALGALSPGDAAPSPRSEDTLEAVHSTLERIVDRLALIEEDIRASGIDTRRSAGDGAATAQDFPAGTAVPAPEIRAAQALARALAPPDSGDDAAPDEPRNLLARETAGLTENVGFTASFIAAARRAAMAAADETRNRPAPSPEAGSTPDAAGRRRSLLIGLGALIAATGAAQMAATLMHGAARLS